MIRNMRIQIMHRKTKILVNPLLIDKTMINPRGPAIRIYTFIVPSKLMPDRIRVKPASSRNTIQKIFHLIVRDFPTMPSMRGVIHRIKIPHNKPRPLKRTP
ncbi:unnamed protein product [Amaranthus hypochondriacus]